MSIISDALKKAERQRKSTAQSPSKLQTAEKTTKQNHSGLKNSVYLPRLKPKKKMGASFAFFTMCCALSAVSAALIYESNMSFSDGPQQSKVMSGLAKSQMGSAQVVIESVLTPPVEAIRIPPASKTTNIIKVPLMPEPVTPAIHVKVATPTSEKEQFKSTLQAINPLSQSFKLNGIVSQAAGNVAILNDRVVEEGSRIGEVLVKVITQDTVTLSAAGKDFTIQKDF